MRLNQVEWAKQYDWFRSAREVDGIWFVTVEEGIYSTISKTWHYQELEFKWFNELKAWAGY